MNLAGLVDQVERRPRTALTVFLVLHSVVWTALPSLLYFNLPLDVIEALTYGREWQLGYEKLPPLPWWLAEAVYRVFGFDAALYALCQAVVIVAFVAVWLTARPLVRATGALAALLILDGLHYLNFSSVKFNHNVIELPLWALAGFAFHAALRRQQLRYWIVLGIALGLGWWAKYFVVILAAPLALFVLLDPQARRQLAGPGPWVGAAATLAVIAPNLFWLLEHGSSPFGYAQARAAPPGGPLDHLVNPLRFLIGQIPSLIPPALIAAPLFWPPAQKTQPRAGAGPDAFDRRIIALLAFGPALTLFAFSLISGRATQATWGAPLWLFIGVWFVVQLRAVLEPARLVHLGGHWAAVSLIFVAAFAADYLVLPGFDHRYRAAFFPGDRLSAAITQRFEQATGEKPAYVIASMWDGGNVAHYSPQRPQPRVLVDGSSDRAPWIDVADLRRHGAVLVWTESDPRVVPPTLASIAPGVEPGAPFDLPLYRGGGIVHVGWAILPPQSP
jgi:4-amino-4-deoxy-L-arabinose transferase-like glycosyltransferase